VGHSTPYSPYPGWDAVLDTLPDGKQADPKNVKSYYLSTQHGIAQAKKAGKPFYLNINVSDPHKPFWNEDGQPERNPPSRAFKASEVPVPGFLFEDKAVREELALYYSSVRRGDDAIGEVLRALKESGEDQRTLIIYLSDHGMPLPWAKTQLYFHSTRSPVMVRWPGVTKPGAADDRHMVSFVDVLPTLLEIVGLPQPKGLDGRSFAPVLRGEMQEGRDFVVTEYNENSGGNRHPMRSIVTKDFAYIFNPWSNGQRVFATATKGTVTYKRMQALAKTDPARQKTVLYVTAEVIRKVAILAQPVVPDSAGKLLDTLGVPAGSRDFTALAARIAPGTSLPAPAPVFPRYVEPPAAAG
jgi:N-sulfoglucosamine sulfohydrolase